MLADGYTTPSTRPEANQREQFAIAPRARRASAQVNGARQSGGGEGGEAVAESEDVPGLVAEAESPPALFEKVRVLVPELLELNGGLEPGQNDVAYQIRAHYEETGSVPVAS